MKEKKKVDNIFKVYNGSVTPYIPPKVSQKSISKICTTGIYIAKGTSFEELMREIRK